MIDLVEDLAKYKKVYVLYDSIIHNEMLFSVYNVTKIEKRGSMKYYAQLKTNSLHKFFKNELNIVGFSLSYRNDINYKFFDNIKDLRKYFCLRLKKEPEKNKSLLKKLSTLYPENFI